MKDLEKYRRYFNMIDDRTPFSLFKEHIFELIELAEGQQSANHPKKEYGESPEDLPNLNGRGTSRLP